MCTDFEIISHIPSFLYIYSRLVNTKHYSCRKTHIFIKCVACQLLVFVFIIMFKVTPIPSMVSKPLFILWFTSRLDLTDLILQYFLDFIIFVGASVFTLLN